MKRYFGESASYMEGDDLEKQEAKQYLEYWKKFLLKRLTYDSCEPILIDEQWITRDAYLSGCLSQHATLALKLYIDVHFKYELR